MSFDPGEPRQRRFTAWGKAKFPDPRDRELDHFVDSVRAGGPAAVKEAADRASEQGRGVLRAYAGRAAARAVRGKDPSLLERAAIGLALGGLAQDSREALMVMPLIEDAAGRLDVPLEHVVEDASEIVGHPGTVYLVRWLSRAPEDRTLAAMGYEAVDGDDGGFRYEFTA